MLGDILWLVGLPLRALHCSGSGPAVLLAVVAEAPMSFRRRGRLKHIDAGKRSEGKPMIHESKEGR